MAPLDAHVRFLEAHGAATLAHTDTGLLAHLRGVHALLEAWGARAAVRDAGLFHSVYGTESYGAAALPLALRDEVRARIGAEAERLAWLFGVLAKASLYANLGRPGPAWVEDRLTGARVDLDGTEFADLCDLTVANWLEQRPRARPEHRFLRREELAAMRPHLLPAGRAALDAAYGFAP
ncbi:MAG: DUF6817 domain-containing protein [Myxococcota bacterium]